MESERRRLDISQTEQKEETKGQGVDGQESPREHPSKQPAHDQRLAHRVKSSKLSWNSVWKNSVDGSNSEASEE